MSAGPDPIHQGKRFVVMCPYCEAGPFDNVAQHTYMIHGKKAADVRREFRWPMRTVLLAESRHNQIVHDARQRVDDGLLRSRRDPRRSEKHRRWFGVAAEELGRPGWGRRLARRWRITESAARGRVRLLRLEGFDLPTRPYEKGQAWRNYRNNTIANQHQGEHRHDRPRTPDQGPGGRAARAAGPPGAPAGRHQHGPAHQ